MLLFSSVTDAQCTGEGVVLMMDGHSIFDGTTLYRPIGDSFIVSCRRCSIRKPVNWFDPYGKVLPDCNDANVICKKRNGGNSLVQDLVVSSFTKSLDGTYSCTRKNGTITISALG